VRQSEDCAAIFKPEIPAEVLISCADAIAAGAHSASLEWCAAWLQGLSAVGRFEMTVLMLDRPAQARLGAMFDALSGIATSEGKYDVAAALGKLRPVFGA